MLLVLLSMLIYISECIAIALLTLTIWLLLLPSSDISLLIRVGALQTVYIFVDLMLPHSWMIVKLSIEFYVIFPEYLDIYYYIPFFAYIVANEKSAIPLIVIPFCVHISIILSGCFNTFFFAMLCLYLFLFILRTWFFNLSIHVFYQNEFLGTYKHLFL